MHFQNAGRLVITEQNIDQPDGSIVHYTIRIDPETPETTSSKVLKSS
jgi:hypothetical protein